MDPQPAAAHGPQRDVPDPHFDSRGRRVYLESVKFVPASTISGWAMSRKGEFEHDKTIEPLIGIASEGTWAEYAIPPLEVTAGARLVDGHHRLNSALQAGRNTLVPIIYVDPQTKKAPDWLAPGVSPKYAVSEYVTGDPSLGKLTAVRVPEWLDMPLGDLLDSIDSSPVRHPFHRGIVPPEDMRAAFLRNGKGGVLSIEVHLVRVDIVESSSGSTVRHLELNDVDFSAADLRLLFSSATLQGQNGATALHRPLRDLLGYGGRPDELRVHLSVS